MGLTIMVGFVVIVGRLFFLQVIQADQGAEQVKRQQERSMTLNADRGRITDRNGKSLALNMEVPSLFAMPGSIPHPAQTAKKLAPLVNLSVSRLTKTLKNKHSFVWIKRQLDKTSAQAIEGLSLPGVHTIEETRRFYPKGLLLAHALGFAGIDNQGLEGIELRYDPYLKGQNSLRSLQRDALGHLLVPVGLRNRPPSHGHHLSLTIDEVIQYIAEQELEKALDRTGAKRGMILIMEPRTGAMLAWALRPSFNPNHLRHLSPDRWRNRAITDPYEPGSTLKIVTAAAALEKGIVDPGTLIYGGEGSMPIAGTVIHDPAKSGWMTFSEVITHSSNVGIIKTAISLGKIHLYHSLRAFGFGEKTHIDLPGESGGILKTPEHWGSRTLASIAIGQEIAVTPLQLITAMSSIANGGWLLQPYLVSEIHDSSDTLIFQRTPKVKRRPISHKTAKTLTHLLENVVRNGTGKRAQVSGYTVAGKTGTAQKFDKETGRYSSSKLIGSFVGFIPSENPVLTILVILDEPKTKAWGGVIAAPVFAHVAERVLRHMGITPFKPRAIKTAFIVRNRGMTVLKSS